MGHNLKITVIASECPYPLVHGGRIDIWRRLSAMKAKGLKIQLIAWYLRKQGSVPDSHEIAKIRSVVDDVILIPIDTDVLSQFRYLIRTVRYPFSVSRRLLFGKIHADVIDSVHKFSPDVVLLDSLYGGVLATEVAKVTGAHLVYRSQNVEHKYIVSQRRRSRNIRSWMMLMLSGIWLKRYEESIVSSSKRIFDISMDDRDYWEGRGFLNCVWLPPFIDEEVIINEGEIKKTFDVGYVGNLFAPNNLHGLRWFVEKVIPLLDPGIRIVIAGSNPSAKTRRFLRSVDQISLVPSPQNAERIYMSAKVLINPIFSGSGVNIKAIEMLRFNSPIVSTSQGVTGLPYEIRQKFLIANSPNEFSVHIGNAIRDSRVDVIERQRLITKYFCRQAIDRFVDELYRIGPDSAAMVP